MGGVRELHENSISPLGRERERGPTNNVRTFVLSDSSQGWKKREREITRAAAEWSRELVEKNVCTVKKEKKKSVLKTFLFFYENFNMRCDSQCSRLGESHTKYGKSG